MAIIPSPDREHHHPDTRSIASLGACAGHQAGSGLRFPRSRARLYGVIVAGGFSLLGNAVASVALPWLVLSLTGNAVWTGVAAAAGMVPLVIGAFLGGPVVDRFGSRIVAVTADLASAFSVAAIPLLFFFGQLSLCALIALIVIGALLDGPGMIAYDARVPELARLARLPIERVTSIDELLENASLIFGPPVAGIAIAGFGIEYALLITAGCSLMAAIIGAISLPPHRRRIVRTEIGHETLAGLRFLISDPLLRLILVVAMVMLAVFGALNAVILPALFRVEGANALDLGLFLAVSGVGAAMSAVAFALWGFRWSGRAILVSVYSGGLFLFASSPSFRAAHICWLLPLCSVYRQARSARSPMRCSSSERHPRFGAACSEQPLPSPWSPRQSQCSLLASVWKQSEPLGSFAVCPSSSLC